MGFRFRKSFNLGGFRINLSKSGIGYSFGAKGLRFTKKASGGTRTTLHVPHTGISYVKDSKKHKQTSGSNTVHETKENRQVSTEFYEEEIVQSTPNEMIDKLNRADKLYSIFKLCRIIFPILAVAFFAVTFSIIKNGNVMTLVSDGVERQADGTALAIVLGLLGALFLGATIFVALQKIEIELQYDLAEETFEKEFKNLLDGLSALQKNERLWELLADGNTEDTISKIERADIKFVGMEPYIKTNFGIVEIQLYHKKLMFLPDLLAIKQQSGWVGVQYSEISITEQEVFMDETETPQDATVVSKKWFYENKDGSRDMRHRDNNYLIYKCKYNGIYIESANGLGLNILCSSLEKSGEFYSVFNGYIKNMKA